MENLLNELCSRMTKCGYQDFDIRRLQGLVNELEKREVSGVDAFIRVLSQRVAERQEYLDITKEGRFALILSRNSFSNVSIRSDRAGCDVKADYNWQTVCFEVTRKRPNDDVDKYDGVVRGVASVSSQNIILKIREEMEQLRDGEINVVVYWSSTVQVMFSDVKDALEEEIASNPEQYGKLSGVLFTGEEGINIPTLRQYYLFKNEGASQPLDDSLIKKLESLHTEDPQKLRRRYKHLGA